MSHAQVNEISCVHSNESIPQNNSTTLVPHMSSRIIFTITGLFFVVNMMLIYGFYKTSRPFSIVTKLFICLSVWDIMTPVGFAVYGTVMNFYHDMDCVLLVTLYSTCQIQFYCGASLFLTISTLRFIALRWPFTRIRNRYVYVALFIQFLIATIITFVPLFLVTKKKRDDAIYLLLMCDSGNLIVFNVSTLIVNILSYAQLGRTKRVNNTENGTTHSGNTPQQQQESLARKQEAVKTLLLITFCYLACNLQHTVYNFLYSFEKGDRKARYISLYIAIGNGTLNSLVYIIRTKKIRNVYVKLFCARADVQNP